MLKAIISSPALRVGLAFGLGGAAFTVGNLILARVLPAEAYGIFSLIVGMVSLASQIAPMGLDIVLPRRGLRLDRHLRHVTLASSLLCALVTAGIGIAVYHLSMTLTVYVLVAVTAVGMSQSAAAHFQGQQQFSFSVPLIQASNWILLLVGVLTAVSGELTANFASALLALASLVAGMTGWMLVIRRDDQPAPANAIGDLWRESLALMSVQAASSMFLQLERLLLPATVGLTDLALFGVLAALVGSPFRVIQAAVGYTVIPGLRAASTASERKRLLRREGLLIAGVLTLGSVGIWFIAPLLAHWLLAGRYELSDALMAATLISGILKIISAIGTAIVQALAPPSRVRLLSAGSWLCIALATACSFPAARWGLIGVMYAISFGWLVRCVIAAWLAIPHLKQTTATA